MDGKKLFIILLSLGLVGASSRQHVEKEHERGFTEGIYTGEWVRDDSELELQFNQCLLMCRHSWGGCSCRARPWSPECVNEATHTTKI